MADSIVLNTCRQCLVFRVAYRACAEPSDRRDGRRLKKKCGFGKSVIKIKSNREDGDNFASIATQFTVYVVEENSPDAQCSV